MKKSFCVYFSFTLIFCFSLFSIILRREIIGPDFNSYINALENGISIFMYREIVSWSIIQPFTRSYDSMWWLASLLHFFLTLSMLLLSLNIFPRKMRSDDIIWLGISLTLVLIFNPFTLLLSSSALRQGIGAIFFIYSLYFYLKRNFLFVIFFVASVLSHNSFIMYYVSFFIAFRFTFIRLEFKILISLLALNILSTLFIPRATLVTESRLEVYLVSHIIANVLAFWRNDDLLKICVFSLTVIPLGFIGDLSYFDRLSLFTSFVVWPLLLSSYYSIIKPKLIYVLVFVAPMVVFLSVIAKFKGI